MNSGARSRFSDFPPRAALGTGLHPAELWGVAQHNPVTHKAGVQTRSAKVRARRALRRAARAAGVPLKQYIRKQGLK